MTYLNAKKYVAALPRRLSEDTPSALGPVLRLCGEPQRNLPYLRLTGSNGKTICAELLLSVYDGSAYRVGYLSSPRLDDPRQAIRIGSCPIAMERFASLCDRLRKLLAALPGDKALHAPMLTQSEYFLCLALLYFAEEGVHFYMVESDPSLPDMTQPLSPPFAAVICGTIPHTNRTQIRGIRQGIRHGIREIVSAPQNSAAYATIADTCAAIHCRLTLPARAKILPLRLTLRSTSFSYLDKEYSLGLCGSFQITNATVALETLFMLGRMGFPVDDGQIARGFARISLPCKFEVLSVSPTIIADSTHAPVAIETVCASMAEFQDRIGRSIRLCLPDGPLVPLYTEALGRLGFDVTRFLLLSDRTDSDGHVFRFEKEKELVRAALCSISPDEILLISGPGTFSARIRHEILKELSF